MSTWRARQAVDGSLLHWAHRPWKLRLNWDNGMTAARRTTVINACETTAQKIGSGCESLGQTTQLFNTAHEVHQHFGINAVLIAAKPFTDSAVGVEAWTDECWHDGEYHAGLILFNSSMWGNMYPSYANVALHETGHLAGLLHPTDGYQLMSNLTFPNWQAGDLAGLAALKAIA